MHTHIQTHTQLHTKHAHTTTHTSYESYYINIHKTECRRLERLWTYWSCWLSCLSTQHDLAEGCWWRKSLVHHFINGVTRISSVLDLKTLATRNLQMGREPDLWCTAPQRENQTCDAQHHRERTRPVMHNTTEKTRPVMHNTTVLSHVYLRWRPEGGVYSEQGQTDITQPIGVLL